MGVSQDATSNPALKVDFTWKKFEGIVTEEDNPSHPVYIADYKSCKHVTVNSGADKKRRIGRGTIHPISIHADYELHGRKGKLQALKKFQTAYTHLSDAYSDGDEPMAMTWSSSCGFKTWDFVCVDEQQNPVARFSSNTFYLKKVGKIEFMGPKATSQAARDEIVVVGLTLYSCMMLRVNNVFNLFGAFFARTGPIEKPVSDGNKLQDDAEVQSVDDSLADSIDKPHDKDIEMLTRRKVSGT